MIDIDALKRDKRPQSAWVVHALIDRLEAAEKELSELRSSMKFRTSLIGRTEAERDALRAKIKQMEQQTPVAWTAKLALEHRASTLGFRVSSVNMWGENGVPLYVLPGAEGEEK